MKNQNAEMTFRTLPVLGFMNTNDMKVRTSFTNVNKVKEKIDSFADDNFENLVILDSLMH